MSKWVRKGDSILVTAGNDKGRVGKVLSRKGDRVVVQGINIRKKHVKRRSETQTSNIIEIERAIHISNVSFCDNDGSRVSVKSRKTDNGKELFYMKDEREVFFRSLKKVK
jgi:large subunit ribosomal protein L24